jgi:hypothetical protein
MIDLQLFRLVLTIADALRVRGSWTGETHIQKVGYFLQEMLGVPLNSEFILYKYGPFSFDLGGVLSTMRAYDYIDWRPKAFGYGPTLVEGPLADTLKKFSTPPAQHMLDRINFISDQLANKRVSDLEKIATALYVRLDRSVPDFGRAGKINELKPHVSLSEAQQAVQDLDKLWTEAAERGFVPNALTAA